MSFFDKLKFATTKHNIMLYKQKNTALFVPRSKPDDIKVKTLSEER